MSRSGDEDGRQRIAVGSLSLPRTPGAATFNVVSWLTL